MKQRQAKAELQLYHHRRLCPPYGHDIRRAHLGFNDITLILQKGFDRRVKVGFARVCHKRSATSFAPPLRTPKLRVSGRW